MKTQLELSAWREFARWAYVGYCMHGPCALVLDRQPTGAQPAQGKPGQPAEMVEVQYVAVPSWLDAVGAYDPETEIVLLSTDPRGRLYAFVVSVDDGPTPAGLYGEHAAALASDRRALP